ncbi:PAS domain S-box protein [Candidatus Falkowbacteria bacterium]|nr:PAS domain S-box protein [Candidatus Falkowbacteria bacterium]
MERSDVSDEVRRQLATHLEEYEFSMRFREIGLQVISMLNESGKSLDESIKEVLGLLKSSTGFDAVGLRLQVSGDYPYFYQKGFSHEFLLTEDSLIVRDTCGNLCSDEDGNAIIGCTCGLIISGKIEKGNPLFTLGGSFWSIDSSELQGVPPDQDPMIRKRDACIYKRYSSVALIPIRSKEKIIGLLQFSDRRKNRFTLRNIELFEMIANHIGMAIMRKKCEEWKRDAFGRLEKIASRLPGMVFQYVLSPSGSSRIPYASAAIRDICGVELDDVKYDASLFFSMVHADDQGDVAAAIRKSASELSPWFQEYRVKLPGGEERWHLVSAMPELEANGSVLWHGFITDITSQKQTALAVQESEAKFRALFEESNVGIAIIDRDLKLAAVNASFAAMHGCSVDEMLSLRLSDLDTSETAKLTHERASRVIRGEKLTFEVCHFHKQGHVICLEVSSSLICQNGEPFIVAFHHDITERKAMQNALVSAERLSAIGQLAEGVAHDYNNSLQIILGNVAMAMLVENLPEEAAEFLAIAQKGVMDAAARVQSLQRFSVRTTGELRPLQIEEVLDDVVAQSKPLWKNMAERQGAVISFIKRYDQTPIIDGDRGALGSALYNLIKNSIEAMPHGGIITLETGVYSTKKEVYLRIYDTGMGMDDETRKRVFEPFHSTKGLEIGRGFGMSNVYSIIRNHNGTVFVKETAPGKGTTIEIVLPFCKSAYGNGNEVQNQAHGSLRVLWVDDESAIRNLGKMFLRKLGHSADVAESGQTALELLSENRYDLMITDIGMQGMNGWQLAATVHRLYGDMLVVVVSGWGVVVSDDEKAEYGISHVLSKPIGVEQLKELTNDLLSKK